jgi:CoA:oxalate CoA-transferase
MLADLGADVVKVEPPAGDESRFFGAVRAGLSGFYTQFNAGKRNVCIDLTRPAGAELVLRLAAHADVVIENFRPGVMQRLGLGYRRLRERNPALVMLSISGFGQTGPASGRGAYAPVVHAESGFMARQADFDDVVPRDPALAVADYNAALHGLVAVLAALRLVERSGTGQHIDMSMFDAALATDDYAHFYLDEQPVQRIGGEIWSAPEGPIMIAGIFYNTWHRLARTFGLVDGLAPGATLPVKIDARRTAVQEWLLSFDSRRELCAALDAARLVWARIARPEEAFSSPQAVARSVVAQIDARDGGTRRVVNAPYHFSAAAVGVQGPAPFRGEHNHEVLASWLGLSGAEVGALDADGVLDAERSAKITKHLLDTVARPTETAEGSP